MKIKIEHLGYTILVKKPNGTQNFHAWVKHDNKNQCTLFINTPIKRINFGTLAHEVTHILQFICQDRSIAMDEELEHMGYLMNYIINKILGIEYNV